MGMIFWIVFLLAVSAFAQTPAPYPDVPLVKSGGIYNIGCVTPLDTDLAQLCFVRSDLPDGIIELGCMPATVPDIEFRMDIAVQQTTFVDAEIRCYVIDDDANVSDYSDNKGDIDFTPPAKGRIK